jgi:archaemetzincin
LAAREPIATSGSSRPTATPGLNFVFGQATVAGRDAFVALPRLRETSYGRPPNESLYRERVLKEVLHELGHTWGLGHCPDPRCVMYFSNMLADTDAKGLEFCPRCREG